MSEAAKIKGRVLPYLENKTVLDLGCGASKIVPWALGVDDLSEHGGPIPVDLRAKVDPDSKELERALNGRRFQVVFSSHTLEHMRAPILETLNYWLRFVEVEGHLILYLPEERAYVFDRSNPTARNPAHKHFLTADTFIWYLLQIEQIKIEEFSMDVGADRYSFLVILKRVK